LFKKLNIGLTEVPDWFCCGATPAHNVDELLSLSLCAKNLELAEQVDGDLAVACAACFSRLKTTQHVLGENAVKRKQVEKAIDAKIPVIVLDRNVDTKRIAQFIGGDNVLIGKAAGEYAVKLLGGPGAAQGNVVEIWGGMGTAPAHDRHDGFHAFTDKEPGIKYLLNNQSGDWKQDKAYNIMTTALRNNEKIDLVYGHNDPMAYGAYLAAKDAGRDKDVKFIIGIDALPDEGVTWVHKGNLTATFLYATPGAEGLRQAVKLLNGEKIPPVITLPTMLVDKNNAEEILKKNGLL